MLWWANPQVATILHSRSYLALVQVQKGIRCKKVLRMVEGANHSSSYLWNTFGVGILTFQKCQIPRCWVLALRKSPMSELPFPTHRRHGRPPWFGAVEIFLEFEVSRWQKNGLPALIFRLTPSFLVNISIHIFWRFPRPVPHFTKRVISQERPLCGILLPLCAFLIPMTWMLLSPGSIGIYLGTSILFNLNLIFHPFNNSFI